MPDQVKRQSTSFGMRLVRLVVLASAVAVVTVCFVLVAGSYYYNLGVAETRVVAMGRMLAINLEGPLSFNDTEAGNETIATLTPITDVAAAAVYDKDGRLFLSYQRAVNPAPLPPPANAGFHYEGGWLVSDTPVIRGADALGTVVLVYDLAPISDRLRSNTLLAAATGVLATGLSLLLAFRLHAQLARPVEALMATARAVTETNDFAIRAPKFDDDEIGRFTDVFNHMLARIHEQAAEINAAHQQLTTTNEELRQKNTEMEQFVYTVSHDLKSPLVTAMGFVGLLKEDAAAGRMADIMDSVDHIARAAQRMSRLIDDLLSLSRIGRIRNEPEPTSMQELVSTLVDDLRPRIDAAGAEVRVTPDLPVLLVDRGRMQQLFENLIVNALKYGCTPESCRVDVGWKWAGNDVRLFVRDYGPGIAPEYHDRIFGLFQRLDNRHEGTGIGLAIVARIMEVHGGRAWVESSPGHGATFWLSFPASTLNSPAKFSRR